jgi:sulfite oxidase
MSRFKYILGTSSIGLSIGLFYWNKNNNNKKVNKFTYDDVSKHDNSTNGIWVTYKDNVYDITNFIENHPGGKDKILLSAGKGLEPYWNIYKQHTNNSSIIKDILTPMKIGTLSNYDPEKYKGITDPYINDPDRDTELNFHSRSPCNAETPKNQIMNNWITPNELWYIRNHHPVPDIDIKKFKLTINNNSLSLEDLKKMKCKKVISTIQCGGNRRGELNNIGKTSGTSWDYGAISTAEWRGVPLRDLLINFGITDNDNIINHVHFEGYEGVKSSIPIEKAMNNYGDVLVAYEMNGEDLPRDHGFPLRVIIPGYVGIRNIKWLKKITTSDKEVDGIWQRGISYKGLPHYIKDANDISIDKIAPIQELPVQSCIVDILPDKEKLKIKGFAWSGGGRGIIRVDISCDGGKTWNMAELKKGSEQKLNKAWAWTFWEFNTTNKKGEIICKATDSSYNTQPENSEFSWNIRGLNNNSWHRIKWNIK